MKRIEVRCTSRLDADRQSATSLFALSPQGEEKPLYSMTMQFTSYKDGFPAAFVVFDFDHTLSDGDAGAHLILWLIRRAWWRQLLALALAPVALPMIAWLPTRRRGISTLFWIGTVGLHRRRDVNVLIDQYVQANTAALKERLLPIAIEVLHQHRVCGDQVLVATGAPPELARAILAFVAHEDVPVIGTQIGPKFGGVGAIRHCHSEMKVRMIREAGYVQPIAIAYSDSRADMPLLQAALKPVVVNPKHGAVDAFRRVLGADTPILNWGCKDRAGDRMP